MNRIVSLVAVLLFSLHLVGGNYEVCTETTTTHFFIKDNHFPDSEYYAGELFIRTKPEYKNLDFSSNKNTYLNQSRAILIGDIIRKYKIDKILQSFPHLPELSNIYRVFADKKTPIYELIDELLKTGYFEYVERVPVVHPNLTPNDIAPEQWYFDRISAPAAWDISTGSASIVVAVVDDAVLTSHSDLSNNIYNNVSESAGASGVDDDANGYTDDNNGWDAADNDNNPNPPSSATDFNFSHGTHMAGIISAVTNNNNGVAALGYNVKILPVKCRPDSHAGSDLPFAFEGISYAVASKPDIINMSWSVYPFSVTLQFLLDAAYAEGIAMFASGGNDGTPTITYPSTYIPVMGVGALDQSDAIESTSNFGGSVDVYAPGVNIYSTVATNNNAYAQYSGSSTATAMVSALAALMKSHDPNINPKRIYQCIENSLDDISDANFFSLPGRINAEEALKCLNIPPFAFFIMDGLTVEELTVCPGATVELQDISLGPDVNQWSWDINGGTPSNSSAQNPIVTFNNIGEYDVTLTASNPYGSDSETLTVNVEQPSACMSGDTIVIDGTGSILTFNFQGTPPYSITYNDGTSDVTINDITENPFELAINPTIPDDYDDEFIEYNYTLVSASDAYCSMDLCGDTVDVRVLYLDPCVDCPYDWVQNTFLGGGCVSAFNVTYTGHNASIGKFENGTLTYRNSPTGPVQTETGTLDIGFDAGIFLVSGNPSETVLGPNTSGGAGSDVGGSNDGDVDLNLATPVGITTNDAAVLEFDFIASSSNVKFNYVFASEEYPEFVCSPFNDAFGFFVSGPGYSGPYTNGAKNIALVDPFASVEVPVTINTVNSYATTPSGYNQNDCTSIAYDDLHIQQTGGEPNTEFDGYTTVFTAYALNLVPCEIYHIKLAVGDASDGILDSGVFLQAKSFTGGGAPNITSNGIFDTATGLFSTFEGCETATFEFTRPDINDTSDPFEVTFEIGGTVTNGDDIVEIPNSIIIPAGEETATLEINALQDGIVEGLEVLTLSLTSQTCECTNIPVTAGLLLYDNVLIDAGEDVVICAGESVQLNASPNDNVSYEWSNPQYLNDPFISNPIATPPVTTTFGVVSVDDKGCEAEDVMTVFVRQAPPVPPIATDTVICSGDVVDYQLSQVAPVNGYTYSWSPATGLSNPNIPNPTVTLGESVSYNLTITNDIGCDTTITVNIGTSSTPIFTELSDSSFCVGDTITYTAESGFDRYEWNTGDTTQSIIVAEGGMYELTVYDELGCQAMASAFIVENPKPTPQILGRPIVNEGEIDTLSLNETFASYNWSTGETSSFITADTSGRYTVTVENEEGCQESAFFDVTIVVVDPFYIPDAFSPNGDGMNDLFYVIPASERITDVELYVYDRWGQKVYGGNGLNNGWNGTYGGDKKAPMGVYVYYGQVLLESGETKSFNGNVTLVR